MAKINWVKVAGVACALGTAALGVVTSVIDEKKTDAKLNEKVAEAVKALAEQEN